MGWTEPPTLSAEDKLLADMSALPPRDHAAMVTLLAFHTLIFDDEAPKPEKSFVKDLGWALLSGCKHAAEMDVLKWLDEHLAKAPSGTTIEQFRPTLARMIVMCGLKADERMKEAQKLIALLPDEETPDAS